MTTNTTDQTKLDNAAKDSSFSLKEHFSIPPDIIYLDGNSLGPLPIASQKAVAKAVSQEWGQGLITSWNAAGWMNLPLKTGARIARLVGAHSHEIVVADSTSLNLFKVLCAALDLQKLRAPNIQNQRTVIVSEKGNFPTDLYMVQGLNALLGNSYELRLVERDDLLNSFDERVAVVLLTQVDYRTGSKLDMAALTAAAQACGCITIWDLAHSAGAFEVDLNGANADYAIGCGYKYLNGGPGAPAFLFVAQRHLEFFKQPLSGWLGHAAPFEFETGYRPAPGIAAAICGSPPILSMTALSAALDVFDALEFFGGMKALQAKSAILCNTFIKALAGTRLICITPTDARLRGSQVSFSLPDGTMAYAVVQALIAKHSEDDISVIGDFRAPNILRFGFAPLYLSVTDIELAAEKIKRVLDKSLWNQAQFLQRNAVT